MARMIAEGLDDPMAASRDRTSLEAGYALTLSRFHDSAARPAVEW